MENNQPKQMEIKIADNIPGGEYSNLAQIANAKEEFLIKFLNLVEGSGRVVGKIILTPGHFKRLTNVMNNVLKEHETKFGVIKEAEDLGKDKEIGFKA
jgi:hypothetical protein